MTVTKNKKKKKTNRKIESMTDERQKPHEKSINKRE